MNDSLLPSRALRVLSAAAGALWWLLVVLWLVLVLAWGALHGWIVPRIGEWRPQLEMQATRALGVPVRIGGIAARSEGLVPTFELRDVVIEGPASATPLRLGRVTASLSPRSLWNLGFEQLAVERPEVEVRRTAAGRWSVAGFELSPDGGDTRAADWFFRQKEVLVLGGTLRVVDEQRQAAPITFEDLQFVSRNGVRRHALRLDATPPAGSGERFTVQGVFRQPLLSTHAGRWQEWTGQLYAQAPRLDLAPWQAWGLPGLELQGGQGGLRAWVDVEQGHWRAAVADVALDGLRLRVGERPALALDAVSGRVGGRRLEGGFELETRGLAFRTGDGRRWPGGDVHLAWTEAGGRLAADRLDLKALAQLATRLPLDGALLAQLRERAPAGRIETLQARWQGPLHAPRRYQVQGRATDVAVEAAAGQPGLRGASLDFELSEAGGKAQLTLRDGALDLPGVLAPARVPLDRLDADLQWRTAGARKTLEIRNLDLRNADLHARGQVAWRAGEGARGPFPGVLDLQLELPRADGARVWRYLPLSLPADARDYVRDAVRAGKVSDGRVRVRGDLRDFPFPRRQQGEFLVTARVRDATYAFAPAPDAAGQWPVLTQLSGELVFEGRSLQVRQAQGRFAGAAGLQVQADASIADLDASTVVVNGAVRGPLAESLAIFNATPVAARLEQPLGRASAGGAAEVRLRLALPLAHMDQSRVQGSVTLGGNDVRLRPDLPLLARARGVVGFSDAGFNLSGVQARALGGDLRIEGGSRDLPAGSTEPGTVVRLQGTATAEGLREWGEAAGSLAGLARRASGAASYSATLGLRPEGTDVVVASDLQGLALDLPAPLGKPAEAPLPLRFELRALPGARPASDQLTLELGRILSARYVRDVSTQEPRVLRGALAVGLAEGEAAPLPDRGVLANIRLASFSVDAWESVLEGLSGPSPGPRKGSASGSTAASDYLPTVMAVRARELTAQGRTLNDVVVGGSREGSVWRANVDARQLNGYVEYREASQRQAGRVLARLSRLSLEAAAAKEVESLLDEQPASMPTLDVVVEDFELRGRDLGRLEIEASNRNAAGVPEWRLTRLSLSMPEASFSASGNWAALGLDTGRPGVPERRRTVMNFRMDIQDSGALLARLGMPGVVRRGRGKLEGQVAWAGSPLSMDYPSMSGNMAVNIESGQFLKADPGLAKLLGVLSLQALPRRLTLDFRDVFSTGFAFDFVRGHVAIEQGVATTNNLQMKGVNAAVLMEGRADIARETQDLKVVVVPEINAGTASLVAGMINPAIGLGTFLAQMFLREPLMRAATQEFHIHGTWTDPQVTRIDRRAEARAQARAGAVHTAPGALVR
ncbi:YhdP family protein [Ramlibacter rhizophilus]|uniref:TIGR02099 family protein n=1 Tax=Ramlibacter rhizophilus TaxID=1781167 RepID=A0A4Z0BJ00_9BURK|nr:YhdP family protein [Ramlibacter rhizophilus]TFY97878.1 TIGR02099 family protein [Ramlibacter rhizophilus]